MKSSRSFLIGMAVLFVLMFALQLRLPKSFVWNPTFSHLDRQPFGSYVFDSVMSQSLPKGYHVTKQSFYQLDTQSKNKKIAVLVVAKSQKVNQLDIKHLVNIAKKGGKVMIVSDDALWCDSIDEDIPEFSKVDWSTSNYFSLSYLRDAIKRADSTLYDSLCWRQHDMAYPQRTFVMFKELLGSTISVDSIPYTVLAYNLQDRVFEQKDSALYQGKHWMDSVCVDYNKEKYELREFAFREIPVAVSVPCGKGELYYVSTPLLFTNYGVLDEDVGPYVFRLMSQLADLPVYRTEAYTNANQGANYSPMRELIKRPPLRWALYLSMLGVILYLVFSARRRQRVIPVIKKPDNKSLEFVKLIGTLYYQRHDNTDLVKKKFRFFAEEVRRMSGIDVSDVNHGDEDCWLLAEKTGMDSQAIMETIRQIRLVLHNEGNVPTAKMRSLIDKMDEILGRL